MSIIEHLMSNKRSRVHALSQRWDLEAIGNKGYVRLSA